jgi:hypothetical protein
MRLLAVLSKRGQTSTLGVLVLTAVVVGSLSGIALVTPRSGLTSAIKTQTVSPNLPIAARAHPRGLITVKSSTGLGVPSLRTARRFFLTEVKQKVSGDWAKAWQSLFPPHQQIAPRDTFVRCEAATPFPAPLESIHVIDVRGAAVRIAGVLRTLPGAAVTVAVKLRWYGPRDPIAFTHTFHLVRVRGHWTWILSPERYRLYLQDACFGPHAWR